MIKCVDYKEIDYGEFKKNFVLVDVRSPAEFKHATIPGAVNVPLFNDEQRRVIGTVYVQDSVEKAKRLGVEAASQNLPMIYDEICKLKEKYHSLVFFCARGGMRSSSLASLLLTLGMDVYKLKGGYKAYRGYINEQLPRIAEGIKFIVITGNTGVGKTKILKELKSRGYDVLDLEECANHRGSLLGSVGLGEENSQKQFDSLVYEVLKNRKSNTVFVEGESRRIGKIIIPDFIYKPMENGIHINIQADMSVRVENILEDYVCDSNDELIAALNELRKYISNRKIDEYIEKVNKNEYRYVVEELMIKYYDPMYESHKYNYELVVNGNNIKKACDSITQWLINFEL